MRVPSWDKGKSAKSVSMAAALVVDVIGFSAVLFSAIQKAKAAIESVEVNRMYSRSIIENVQDLEDFLTNFRSLANDDITDLVKQELHKVQDTLERVQDCCKSISRGKAIPRMFDATLEREKLDNLNHHVKHARDSLCMVLQLACQKEIKNISENLKQGKPVLVIQEDLKQKYQEILNAIHHPTAGIYTSSNHRRPKDIQILWVSLVPEGDLMEVCWEGHNDDGSESINYELCLGHKNGTVFLIPASKVKSNEGICSLRLGYPQIRAGEMYTIVVRAVCGSGPGEWSKPITFRFSSGPPSRPVRPKVIAESPTQVRMEVKKLLPEENRGSEVTQCEVQYMEVQDSGEANIWKSQKIALKKRHEDIKVHKFVIGSLNSHTKYRFRVVMINSRGKSEASETCEMKTACFVPGAPQNVRISSKRTSDCLKLRWTPPSHNSGAVNRYKIQYKHVDNPTWVTTGFTLAVKHSKKVAELDTDTAYKFRVQALNHDNEGGNWSSEVRGETRFGAFGRTLLTIAAAAGGTVAAPIIGGVGMGTLGAQSAEELPDTETGKKAASVAAGIGAGIAGAIVSIVGAPFVGVTTGIAANLKLRGELDFSPQSSDDEDDVNVTLLQKTFR